MLTEARSEMDRKNVIEQGFTLVELLIVIVILGILAGIVVFAVGNLTSSASGNGCKTEASTYYTALNAYNAQNPSAMYTDTAAKPQTAGSNLVTAGLLQSSTFKFYWDGTTPATQPANTWKWTTGASGKLGNFDVTGC